MARGNFEPPITMENMGSLTGRAFMAAVARIDLPERTRALDLHLSSREKPVTITGEDVAYHGGHPERDDLPDVTCWIATPDEFQNFVDQATGSDEEWAWFLESAASRQAGDQRSNLFLAIGSEPGVMSGFLLLRRGLSVESRKEIGYHFEFDRAYLLPEARGAGLSTGFVAMASLVFRHEMDVLAESIAPGRGSAVLMPFVGGEAASAGGERLLNALVEEIHDVCEMIDDGHDRVTIDEVSADIAPYEPDEDSSPRP